MRIDFLVWFGRLVAAVFVIGALALLAGVAVIVRQAEGVPPMPVALGMAALSALVLLAAAAVALVSIAHSARRGAAALERLPALPAALRPEAGADAAPADEAPVQGPLRPVVTASRSNRPTVVARR